MTILCEFSFDVTNTFFFVVVVDSLPGSLPIDIDSVLFLEKGTKPLGHVFDVLGNVSSPMYCVRFNSNQQIREKAITVGSLVYVAPRTQYTSFVIVSELMKQKGCDASWKNDIESQTAQDYSDDEEERKARRSNRGRNNSCDSESDAGQNMLYGNNQRSAQHQPPIRRGGRGSRARGGRGRSGSHYRGNHSNVNHFSSPINHSWHHNLQPPYQNSPMQTNFPMVSSFPATLFSSPPPPPPPPQH